MCVFCFFSVFEKIFMSFGLSLYFLSRIVFTSESIFVVCDVPFILESSWFDVILNGLLISAGNTHICFAFIKNGRIADACVF